MRACSACCSPRRRARAQRRCRGCWCPCRCTRQRLRERGFNQAYALARYAGRMLEVPYARTLLRRVRDTPSQTALDMAARRHNVRGAFAVCGPRAMERLLAVEHVAIVDDVMTTGSTLAELRAVLYSRRRQAGGAVGGGSGHGGSSRNARDNAMTPKARKIACAIASNATSARFPVVA